MHHLYEKLINKVLTRISLSRVQRVESETVSASERFTKPFVTISREPGSGGKPVARIVAKRLGFDLYDKRLLEDVSRSFRQRKALLESIDERGRNAVEDIVHSIFNPDYVSDVSYIEHLSRVVLAEAIKGEVVILGRGANFITPLEKGLHVRICAPYPVRVERAVKFEKISREEAIRVIKETDSRRKAFIRQYFGKNISNPNYYDLVINSANMSIENVAGLVLSAFQNKFSDYAKSKKFDFSKP